MGMWIIWIANIGIDKLGVANRYGLEGPNTVHQPHHPSKKLRSVRARENCDYGCNKYTKNVRNKIKDGLNIVTGNMNSGESILPFLVITNVDIVANQEFCQ